MNLFFSVLALSKVSPQFLAQQKKSFKELLVNNYLAYRDKALDTKKDSNKIKDRYNNSRVSTGFIFGDKRRIGIRKLIKNITESKIIDDLTEKLMKKILLHYNNMLRSQSDNNSAEFVQQNSEDYVERIEIYLGDDSNRKKVSHKEKQIINGKLYKKKK